MFFRQILHEDLGCASYVVADGGEAAVVDPKWAIDDYLDAAEEAGARIAHVLETHTHADHVSGRGRLQAATGATIHVSEAAGAAFEHRPLRDGDAVAVGDVELTALATPGHRPEHLAFVVRDHGRSADPWMVLTGDSLFVGDVARPDLAVEPDRGARELHRSLRRLLALDDFVEVWPGHIGGSLCGGPAMSPKPGSTVGFERRFNGLLRIDDEERFVAALTTGLAPQPPNFRRIVELNRGPLLGDAADPGPLAPERVRDLMDAGAALLDGRAPREFDAEHVPGSINIAIGHSAVGTRAAWIVGPDADVVCAAGADAEARRMAGMLMAVGLRRVRGVLAGGVTGWVAAGLPVERTEAIDVPGLARRLAAGDVALLDVREDDEWALGHVDGALHVPFHDLAGAVPAAVRDAVRPLAVACSAGNRSSIATSLLRRAGVHRVIHVADGGVEDLSRHGVALRRPPSG